ncbi:MAG: SMI1/KNR4 family protein [Anaerolineae bacterium]|nr:SMI1/KNR4 family protein [Anaerolineae bacterium]
MTMLQLIQNFDRLYQEQVPLRYATLQPGHDFVAVDELCARLQVDSLPEEYIALYRWKNGQQDLPDGWVSEFEEDAWYESVPLDDTGHFVSIESAISLVRLWREIKAGKAAANQPCYWKEGFIPLLEEQAYGLVVVDTRGYFGGKAGQLLYFDYKCADGYTVVHESIARWLETNIALLERGVFFRAESIKDIQTRVRIGAKLNGKYTKRFQNPLPLE